MPLHVCAKHGAVKCADLLLRRSTNIDTMVNEPDQIGFTALFYAIVQESEAMIDLLITSGAKLTATLKPSEIGMYLCNCVKNNQLDRLKAWHRAGANLDQTDYDGRTPVLLVGQLVFSSRNCRSSPTRLSITTRLTVSVTSSKVDKSISLGRTVEA